MRNPGRILLLLSGLAVALVVVGFAVIGAAATIRRLSDDTDSAPHLAYQGIVLPPGFTAEVYAQPDDVEVPGLITFDPEGRLYLLTVGGKIFRMEDTDNDHKTDSITLIFDNANHALTHSVGMAFRKGVMYISDSGRISTLEDSNGDGKLDKLTPLVEGLPSLGFPDHSNNGIVFGPDDKLYVGVGATTDHGPLRVPMEGSILRMNPDGSNLEIYATGFRNPYDLVFSPEGALFTADNNPSELDETLRYLPPEELDQILPGRDYGFPRVYGYPPPGDNSIAPITEFYASVGSAGITYYAGDTFPPDWRNGVYVAQWGTGANVALDRSITNGQSLVFVPLTQQPDGTYTGDFKPFLYFDTEKRLRPVDVTVGPDGALYMLEFEFSTVYRISYNGDVNASSSTATPMPTPEPVPTFPADQIENGRELFENGVSGAPACITCHLLGGKVGLGPSLEGLRDRAGLRVPSLNAVDYVRQSIRTPNAYIVPTYNANYMFQNYATTLSDEQVNSLVAYVLSLEAPK